MAIAERAVDSGMSVTIPAPVLAQVIRNPARQARIRWLLRQPDTSVVALDEDDVTEAGLLLARTGTSDIADAHVVVCARRTGRTVLTSDAADLRRLDPDLQLLAV